MNTKIKFHTAGIVFAISAICFLFASLKLAEAASCINGYCVSASYSYYQPQGSDSYVFNVTVTMNLPDISLGFYQVNPFSSDLWTSYPSGHLPTQSFGTANNCSGGGFKAQTFTFNNMPAGLISYQGHVHIQGTPEANCFAKVADIADLDTDLAQINLPPIPPAPTITLSADRTNITIGDPVTFTLTIVNGTADSCTAWSTPANSPGYVDGPVSNTGGSLMVNPQITAQQSVKCTNWTGSNSASVNITVNPQPISPYWQVRNPQGGNVLTIDNSGNAFIPASANLYANDPINPVPQSGLANSLILNKSGVNVFVFNQTSNWIKRNILENSVSIPDGDGDDLVLKNSAGTNIAHFEGNSGDIILSGTLYRP